MPDRSKKSAARHRSVSGLLAFDGARSRWTREDNRSRHMLHHALGKIRLVVQNLADRPAAREDLLGEVGSPFVVNDRDQRRCDRRTGFQMFTATVRIGRDAGHALFPQDVNGIGQERNRLQDIVRNHRLHHVELQLTGFRRERDGQIRADDLEGNLVDHLRHDWVDLAGHDRGDGLEGWEIDLAQTTSRTARQQPQVIADFRQIRGRPLQHPGEQDERPGIPTRFDEIHRGVQGQTGESRQLLETMA